MNTSEQLAAFIREHGFPASAEDNGWILTEDHYVSSDGVFHRDPILVYPSWSAVREWLGY